MDTLSNSSKNIITDAIRNTNSNLCDLYMQMERYINDGSPSGFKLGLPEKYSPYRKKKYIKVPLFKDDWTKHIQIGQIPQSLKCDNGNIPFLLHPSIYQQKNFKTLEQFYCKSIEVQPSASGRTMFMNGKTEKGFFIKLHYPEKLGRFKRDLNLFRWLSTLEKSREIYLNQSNFPAQFGFLYDFGGVFHQHKECNLNFGTIFRDSIPTPINPNKNLLIPSFSLFANKIIDGRNQSVLADINDVWDLNLNSFLELFIYPLIDVYFYLSKEVGLIPEFNAQNLLYEIDLINFSTRIILRDVGDCFIDYKIRRMYDLHTNFCTYKKIDPETDTDFFKRRSFAFDFKLSLYVIKPLLEEYSKISDVNENILIKKIKEYVRENVSELNSYFKHESWFLYPNDENVSRANYIEKSNPLFR